jgi:hypothetical protein
MAGGAVPWALEDLPTPTSGVEELRAQPSDEHLSQLKASAASHTSSVERRLVQSALDLVSTSSGR